MRYRNTLAATTVLLLTLTACGSSDTAAADTATCKTAMAKQYKTAVTKGDDAPEGKRPSACEGVSAKTLKRLSGEVIKEYLDSPDAEKLVQDSIEDEAAEIPPACREWIEAELLDATEDMDVAAGQDVCGDLTEDELTEAVDTVTEDLMDAGATPSS